MLPHDRSKILTLQNSWYKNIVHEFFERELKIDGEDITSNSLSLREIDEMKASITAKQEGILAGQEEVGYFLQIFFHKHGNG